MTFKDRLAALGFVTYDGYLRSPHWKELKARLRATHSRCAVCGATPVQFHHNTYERLGCERPSDLNPLCDKHHDAVHKRLDEFCWTVERTAKAISFLRRQEGLPAQAPALSPHKNKQGRFKKKKKTGFSDQERWVNGHFRRDGSKKARLKQHRQAKEEAKKAVKERDQKYTAWLSEQSNDPAAEMRMIAAGLRKRSGSNTR